MTDIVITKPGSFVLNGEHSLSKSIVYITGDAGGAVLDLVGFGGVLVDGAGLLVGSQTEVHHGAGSNLQMKVTGGTPNLVVRCVGLH